MALDSLTCSNMKISTLQHFDLSYKKKDVPVYVQENILDNW